MYQVEIRGIEEAQHPFYIIQYRIVQAGNEWLKSVARYVHTNQGGRVQFLEPDLKKMRAQQTGLDLINQVEKVLLTEGQRLARENRK